MKGQLMNLDDFYSETFLPAVKLRANTLCGYNSCYRKHISPAFGTWELVDISRYEIEKWQANFSHTGAAKKAFAVLRCLLRKAVKWGLLSADPTFGVDRPRHFRRLPEVLNIEGVRSYLKAFYGHALEPLVLVMTCCGLRRGEALGLAWSDIDLRSGEVHIRRTRQSVGGRETVLPVKTELSQRVGFLPKFATQRLRELKGRPADWICPLHPDKAYRLYRSATKRLGLPYVSLSNLRHTYATTSLAAGNDLAIVSKMLGHTDITTTARYYLVPDRRLLKQAQATWERFVMG